MPGRYREGPGPWCGTLSGYTHHRCRCSRCREAWRLNRRPYVPVNPPRQLGDVVHHPRLGRGVVVAVLSPGRVRVRYGTGKRHFERECRTGALTYRRSSATSVRRRPTPERLLSLELLAEGYKPVVIARKVGVHETTVRRWRREAR